MSSAKTSIPIPGLSVLRTGGRKRNVSLLVAAGLVLVVAVGAVMIYRRASAASEALANVPTFTVMQGPLTINVTESGTISSKDQVVVKSHVEGKPTIIYLIPEGTHVKKGDLLVQLDASGLKTDLIDQEISVQNAQAAQIQASEALAVAKNQAKADVEKAKLDYQFAQEDLDKYKEGEYPLDLNEAKSKITLAQEKLSQAKDTFSWSQQLYGDKYISENELKKDKLAQESAQLDYDLALQELQMLKEYTYKRQVTQLSSDVEQAKLALDRTVRSAKADVIKAQSSYRAKTAEYDRQKAKRDKTKDQIEKCRITAPTSGMVVYATSANQRWWNNTPLDEGQTVRERQDLIYLPTDDDKVAQIKVHESALNKVSVGQPVVVTIDALPGKKFTGKVSKIAPLPDAQASWANPDLKVYDTQIPLSGDLANVRTGMTCQASILVAHYDDAVYVPVQAVVRVGNQPTAWMLRGDKFEPVPVEIGLSNNRMVRVLKGLEAGEVVSLTPPLAAAKTKPAGKALAPNAASPSSKSGTPTAAPAKEGGEVSGASGHEGKHESAHHAPAKPKSAGEVGKSNAAAKDSGA